MVVRGNRWEILDLGFVLFGTRQQDVPVILRQMTLSDGFGPVLHSFTVRDVTSQSYRWSVAAQMAQW
ncbi:unnamed protein product [Schistosoma mattheei]|uniref:Uncharacterized protein n=1 Tax=Schistosoma mattheei TaxID=31246 RepID=A0A183Q7K7_9TREM|nr:unnamed protein product [Schistosoma mattheei]